MKVVKFEIKKQFWFSWWKLSILKRLSSCKGQFVLRYQSDMTGFTGEKLVHDTKQSILVNLSLVNNKSILFANLGNSCA